MDQNNDNVGNNPINDQERNARELNAQREHGFFAPRRLAFMVAGGEPVIFRLGANGQYQPQPQPQPAQDDAVNAINNNRR